MVAAQERPDSRTQFAGVERLQQVIVCPEVEALDPITDLVPCRQHQNGSLAAPGSQPLEHFKSRYVGQADIQYDQTEGLCPHSPERRPPAPRAVRPLPPPPAPPHPPPRHPPPPPHQHDPPPHPPPP